MSSPFTLFRRHQRILMVVITGLSMISFVLLGAVQDPRNVPTPLIVIFLAAICGGIAWLSGLSRGKGSEWGLTGALLGAVIGVGAAFYTREASAVYIDSGSLTAREVSELRRQRYIVNRFIHMAFQQTFNMPLQSMPAPVQRQFLFGFSNGDDVSTDDVVVGELLRREADRMGIAISDKVVTDFIKSLTSKKGLMEAFEQARGQMNPQEAAMWGFYLPQLKEKPLTAQAFTKIRQTLQMSETGLLNAIRDELRANQAYELLSGNNFFPPEQFWQYYQKMNVRESAEVASVSVKDFIDPDQKPTDAELNQLFETYRMNFPGYTATGSPEPGRPGFYQPQRIQVGYLEAVYEEIEPLVGEVSEEEIQKLYESKYLKAVPTGEQPEMTLDGPDLPAPPAADKPAESAPQSPPKEEAAPPKPEASTEEKPAEPAAAPAAPAPATPEPAAEPKPEPAPPTEGNSSSLMPIGNLQLVAFLQAEETAPAADAAKTEEPPAEEKPAPATPAETKPEAAPAPADAPAADKPAQTPAADKPADAPEMKPGEEVIPPAPSDETPAAPQSEVPPLDDALKAELRAEILKERTQKAIQERMEAAQIEMSRIAENLQREKNDPDHITLAQAEEKLKFYAGQNQLIYVVTPAMSYQEFVESEDYPVGKAATQQRMIVAEALFRSAPSDLYRVASAADFNSSNAFVYWKLADKPAYPPNTMDDDPGIRAQVVEAWNLEQARPKAQARAEELKKMVQQSDKSMGEALAEQTVTGKESSLYIPVRITGDFTWMQKPMVPPTGMNQPMPVRPSVIPGVPDVGDEFFQEVFNELEVGEIGIAPNNDHTTYYVVKVESRDPSTPEQLDAMRSKFLAEGMQGGYSSLLQQSLRENSINWLQQLFDSHGVVIRERFE